MQDNEASKAVAALQAREAFKSLHDLYALGAQRNVDEESDNPLNNVVREEKLENCSESLVNTNHVVLAVALVRDSVHQLIYLFHGVWVVADIVPFICVLRIRFVRVPQEKGGCYKQSSIGKHVEGGLKCGQTLACVDSLRNRELYNSLVLCYVLHKKFKLYNKALNH